MDEEFQLPVFYNGRELLIPARLHLYGFTQKIETNVESIVVMFERDEERNWRAIVTPVEWEKNRSIKPDLLQAIARSIEAVLA